MHPPETLGFTMRVAKSAQYEVYEFLIGDDGVVVRNCSPEFSLDREYMMTIQDELTAKCDCPVDARFNGACKHQVAVAIREPVQDAVVAETVAAGGGTTVEDDWDSGQGDYEGDECDRAKLPDSFHTRNAP